jgi:hypothetical protein
MDISWSEIRFSQARSEQRQARIQELLGPTTFEDLLAVFVWARGGRAADSQSVWNVQRSRFGDGKVLTDEPTWQTKSPTNVLQMPCKHWGLRHLLFVVTLAQDAISQVLPPPLVHQ